ncbi:LexA family transcriptional regulator [Hymenobacter sp. M29]|uniref:LexA family transcriptional regulator n=1 Tax=Hymenobacter mellowenesis TaxID=3063995 RepID=A0ABT9A9D8_9BACT|nr:LexA family transcriptional regulator [Hymenobacter sp. M29]MDO7846451.1 LexA family transcriptional regulator [Hymenobacter sp. M29]
MTPNPNQATRLAELRRKSGLTLKEVEEALRKADPKAARSFAALGRYEKDGTIRISIETLHCLAKLYKTTPEYIEHGIGGVNAGDATTKQKDTISNARIRPARPTDDEPLYLPRVPVRARASFAESFASDAGFEDYELSLIQNPTPEMRKNGSIEMEIDGDSMEPTLLSGWFVACTLVDKSNFKYMTSGVYAIVFGNHFVVKRIKDNDLSRNGTLTLHSDNERAGSLTINEEDIVSIWKVQRVTEGKIM